MKRMAVCSLRVDHSRGSPCHGQDIAATNLAYNVAKAYNAEHQTAGSVKVKDGGVVAFFSLRCRAAARHPYHRERSAFRRTHSSWQDHPDADYGRCSRVSQELSSLPFIHATGGLTIAQPAARARAETPAVTGSHRRRLLAASHRLSPQGGGRNACRKFPKSRSVSRHWRRNSTFRSWGLSSLPPG